MAVKLAKLGYYAGNPDAVMNAPYSTVLKIIAYERFDHEYTETYLALNKAEVR